MPNNADVYNTIQKANDGIRDRSLLVTSDKKITEMERLEYLSGFSIGHIMNVPHIITLDRVSVLHGEA